MTYFIVKDSVVEKIQLDKNFKFEDSEFIYKVSTHDSSGSKVYLSNTKDDAWRSLDFMLFGGLYEVESKLDDVDDMIPF